MATKKKTTKRKTTIGKLARASVPKAAKERFKGAPAAGQYQADFPLDYPAQQGFEVKVKAGFEATVAVLPQGLDENNRMKFRIDLYVSRVAGAATFTPKSLGMMLIHIPLGLRASPGALKKIEPSTWRNPGRRSAR